MPCPDVNVVLASLREVSPALVLGANVGVMARWWEKGPVKEMLDGLLEGRASVEKAMSARNIDWTGTGEGKDWRKRPSSLRLFFDQHRQDWELVHPLYYKTAD